MHLYNVWSFKKIQMALKTSSKLHQSYKNFSSIISSVNAALKFSHIFFVTMMRETLESLEFSSYILNHLFSNIFVLLE